MPGGSRSAAARRSAVLCEARRRLPETASLLFGLELRDGPDARVELYVRIKDPHFEKVEHLLGFLAHGRSHVVIRLNADAAEKAGQDRFEAGNVARAGAHQIIRNYPQKGTQLEDVPGIAAENRQGGIWTRQRVALARAFLRDSPLLLLDEPTANLDGQTEHEILEAVRRLSHGRTVVLVAHRPALLSLADRVLTLGAVEVPA